MDKKFTEEDIKKALEQAEANMSFEDVEIPTLENEKAKVLRKDLKNDRRRI